VTIKPRAARALRDARLRLRDAAAASHAAAVSLHDKRSQELSVEEDTLDTFLDEAAETLAAARSVDELDRVAETTGVHRLNVVEAAARRDAAAAASRDSASKLRATAQKLRTAERLVERADEYVARRESTAEQRSTDDLAARRRP
jgi:hypothetical protein